MGKTDLTNVLVSVFKISITGSQVAVKRMGHLEMCSFAFLFLASFGLLDVQDLNILLGIILFEIILASSQHWYYGLKCIFCVMFDRI